MAGAAVHGESRWPRAMEAAIILTAHAVASLAITFWIAGTSPCAAVGFFILDLADFGRTMQKYA